MKKQALLLVMGLAVGTCGLEAMEQANSGNNTSCDTDSNPLMTSSKKVILIGNTDAIEYDDPTSAFIAERVGLDAAKIRLRDGRLLCVARVVAQQKNGILSELFWDKIKNNTQQFSFFDDAAVITAFRLLRTHGIYLSSKDFEPGFWYEQTEEQQQQMLEFAAYIQADKIFATWASYHYKEQINDFFSVVQNVSVVQEKPGDTIAEILTLLSNNVSKSTGYDVPPKTFIDVHNNSDSLSDTLLHKAVNGDCGYYSGRVLSEILKYGPDVNNRNSCGNTPLHVIKPHFAWSAYLIKPLLDAGANINAKNFHGATPLHTIIAARNCLLPEDRINQLRVIDELIFNKADVNAVDDIGSTPLHFAANKGREDIIQRLVAAGADVKAVNAAGHMYLDTAAERRLRRLKKNKVN